MESFIIPKRNTSFRSAAIFLGLILTASHAVSQTPAAERAAKQLYLEDVPFVSGSPISCPGHPIDGLLVDATITVFGVEQNGGGNMVPWNDNAGGQHVTQVGHHLYFKVWDTSGTYTWHGEGQGRFMLQAGGGNGNHFGGVIMGVQEEYYYADGDYPDLWWFIDFSTVIDAKGNVRRDEFAVSEADFVCIME